MLFDGRGGVEWFAVSGGLMLNYHEIQNVVELHFIGRTSTFRWVSGKGTRGIRSDGPRG